MKEELRRTDDNKKDGRVSKPKWLFPSILFRSQMCRLQASGLDCLIGIEATSVYRVVLNG